jgi:hypothetical protein
VLPLGEGEQRHPHLSAFGRKSWGVAGRQNKNFYDESVKVLMQKRQTQEDDEASLEEEERGAEARATGSLRSQG